MAKFHKVTGVLELTVDDVEALYNGQEMFTGHEGEEIVIRLVRSELGINTKGQVLNALGLKATTVTTGMQPSISPKPAPGPTRLSDGKPIGSPPVDDDQRSIDRVNSMRPFVKHATDPPEPTTVEKGGTPH